MAQGKDAFGWKSDLYVDDTSPIPKAVQRVVNVISRARALHPSPDKREQLDSGGPARHSRDNVDMTTVIDNMAKKGMPRIIRDLIDLQAMCPEVDISGLAAFINRLEAMTSASVSRRSVFSKGLRRYLAEKEAGDLFLDGSNPGFGWRAALPESSIERVIASYSDRDIELIESIEEKLKSDAVKWRVKRLVKKVRQRLSKRDKKAVELVYNADSVCTLVYGSETTTRELATLVSRVVLRYLLLCGKLWVLAKRDFSSAWLDPIAVFMHLVESVVVAGYVRFRDKDGKPELLGTVDLISGLPHIRGGLSGSSGKVTYLAHEQHGLPASMYNGDDDDDSFGNHGHESFPVNLTRGSWPFPTMWAHLSSRQPALQKLADKLAPVGVLQKVQLPDFEPTKQMEAMWRHNHVDPLDAVARDPSLPQRMKEGLNSAEQEVKNAAAARRQQQADADKTAKAQGRHLMAGRCDTCGIALLSHGTCVACRRDAKRLEGQRKHLQRFEQALRKAKELGYVGNAKPIVRAAEPRAIVPRLPDELNVGYGIQAAAELQETFFSFECARYRRVREKGWAEGTADASICDICVHVERRNSDEFQRRPVCYQCGIDKCREWRKGPVWAAMICLPCWTSQFVCHCGLIGVKSSFWFYVNRATSDERECDNCYRRRLRGGAAWTDRKRAGTCLYPGCTTTWGVWRWWRDRDGVGRVCMRHHSTLHRPTNGDEHKRLTALSRRPWLPQPPTQSRPTSRRSSPASSQRRECRPAPPRRLACTTNGRRTTPSTRAPLRRGLASPASACFLNATRRS